MVDIDKAVQIAAKSHEGQKDKVGAPYILHPIGVMMRGQSDAARIVGVLHDVVEDTQTTIEDLEKAGFAEGIVAAVRCMTHSKDESYADYVVRCKGNATAHEVKLADLTENSRLDRIMLRPEQFESDMARIRRYLLSYKYLTDQMSESDYRRLMKDAAEK